MPGCSQPANPQRIFLTGEPGSGKTTVMKRAAQLLQGSGLKVGGMVSKEIRVRGVRVGFGIEDYITRREGVLASVGGSEGPHVGKYTVNLRDLDEVGAAAIQEAIAAAHVILIDELGPMELHSHRFVEAVEAALNSMKHLLGTIHKTTSHPLVIAVKSNPKCTIVNVTPENRDELPTKILARIALTK